MQRTGIWIANGGLFVLCCYLLATTINQIGAEVIAPELEASEMGGAAPTEPARAALDHQIVIERNLFNVSTLVPAVVAAPVEEDLEATKLPLRLIGTAASDVPEISWAAVEDLKQRKHVVVRIDDLLADSAVVVAIERGRIVIDNRGRREELALEELAPPDQGRAAGRRTGSVEAITPQRNVARSRASSERPAAPRRSEQKTNPRDPSFLFSQARFLPKYEEGQMLGVELTAVKDDSIFKQIGIGDGDIIVEFNGIRIDNPRRGADLLRELVEATSFEVTVVGADQVERTINYTPDDQDE